MKANHFIETDFVIRDISLRVKHWHVNAAIKVIALHGWLDNAGSFDQLASYLPNCSIAAIDLAGQGFSDCRPASASYHLWDDMVDIIAIADALDWQEFVVIGHSRGAMLANMLAATFPERIKMVIVLDAVMPMPELIANSVKQLRHFVSNLLYTHQQHFYQSREQALQLRAKASAVEPHLLEAIAARQLCYEERGWYWRVDARLKNASAIKMTQEHIECFLSAIKAPVLIILATQGLGQHPSIKTLEQSYPQFNWHYLSGHHHFHMIDDIAEEISTLCIKYLF